MKKLLNFQGILNSNTEMRLRVERAVIQKAERQKARLVDRIFRKEP